MLDEKTRRAMTASYALPDLETAVQQGEVTFTNYNGVKSANVEARWLSDLQCYRRSRKDDQAVSRY